MKSRPASTTRNRKQINIQLKLKIKQIHKKTCNAVIDSKNSCFSVNTKKNFYLFTNSEIEHFSVEKCRKRAKQQISHTKQNYF